MPRQESIFPFPVGVRPRGIPLHRWLYDELRGAILSGRLRPGARLPSSRQLARQQSVARATVVAVFEQLIAEGYVRSRTGSGTCVAGELPDRFLTAPTQSAAAAPARAPKAPAERATEGGAATRAFALHRPAVDSFPVRAWAQLAGRRLRLSGAALLEGGEPAGWRRLREEVADYLRRARSVRCGWENVFIVSGTMQALDFVARLVLRPGDRAWVEDPGFAGAAEAFRLAGAEVVPIPVDTAGLALTPAVRRRTPPTLIYATPAHQYPLGVRLSLERRLAWLEFAARHGSWIFEDDYDGEFRYDVRPLGALQGHDRHERVIYAGSFNKLLFPSLRLGYVVLPPALADPFLVLRDQVDRHVPVAAQAVLADFIAEGLFERHIRKMRSIYREKRDRLVAAADRQLAGRLTLERNAAGFQITGLLPPELPDRRVQQCAAERGVAVRALSSFYLGQPRVNGLLLGFGSVRETEIEAAVKTLSAALAAAGKAGS